jgi:uroporphyrinogen-III synthase
MSQGICFLVGAGPGVPLLLTIKARDCISRAEVLVHDSLCHPLVLEWAREGVEKISAGETGQETMGALLVAHVRQGKTVTRLQSGEVGGRGEEVEALAAAGCRFEIIPGVGSPAPHVALPLSGKRIAVTRSSQQAGELLSRLRELGADAFEMPTIRIEPAPDKRAFYEAVAYSHTYDWLVFTSANGVDAFFEVFYEIYRDARELGGVRIAAVGPATTARVNFFRFQVDVQPEKHVAEALVAALKKETSLENLKILYPRAEKVRDVLAKELFQLGAIVDETIAYRTVPVTEEGGGIARYRAEGADMVTFTSSSTVENFHALGLPRHKNVRFASIGPITSQTLKAFQMPVALEAPVHDVPGLVGEILRFYS